MYIYQYKQWPNFTWDQSSLATLIADIRYLQGRLLGQMAGLGFKLQEEATLETLTQDVIKTTEIEGEKLNADQVRSSIAKRLGINIGGPLPPSQRHVDGIVEVMLDATQHYNTPLSEDRLFSWHAALFPMGRSGLHLITTGYWRTQASGVMQVISGSYGREKVHFEAPSFDTLEKEMKLFIWWFNANSKIDLVVKSAIAHFWFVTIHPFEDGNGRIARALGDMILARSENSKQRFYSMSSQIQRERKDYYNILEKSQKNSLDITLWIEWYLHCLKRAILASEKMLKSILIKANFWQKQSEKFFNVRQRDILNRLLDNAFEGKLTSSKWAKITKCSQDTALRDINELLEYQILIKDTAGGRSTSYILNASNSD